MFTTNLKAWSDHFKYATIGGFVYPLEVNITKDILNISFTHGFQLQNLMKPLPFRASKRVVVQGKIIKLLKVKLEFGAVTSEEVVFDSVVKCKLKQIGDKGPVDLPISVFALPRDLVIEHQSSFWQYVNLKNSFANPATFFLGVIQLKDCIVNCDIINYPSLSKMEKFDLDQRFELEVHRYKVPDTNFVGIHIACLGNHSRENLTNLNVKSFEGCDTQDLLDVLE